MQNAPVGKRELKTQENRNKILFAANKLFNEKGYNETTMADIAKEAVLTNGTIYHLYNSKQDILLAIYNHYFKPDIGLNLDLEKKLNDPINSITEFLLEYERLWMKAGWAVALNIYTFNPKESSIGLSNIHNGKIEAKYELLSFMNAVDKRGLLKDNYTPLQATDSIFIFGRGMLFQWALSSGSYDLVETSLTYWPNFLLFLNKCCYYKSGRLSCDVRFS